MLVILALILSLIFIYTKTIKHYSTWTKRGVKQTNPSLFGDNAGPILGRESFFDMLKNLYNTFPEERYFGTYQMSVPTLMIRDPELIKTLTIKDFDHFVNRNLPDTGDAEPMWSKNLVNMKDKEWKQMRMTLSPSFTSSKMKSIFNIISECCAVYVKHFQHSGSMKVVELKNMTASYTNDVITSVAFGIKCDSIKDKDNEFLTMAKNIESNSGLSLLSFFAYNMFPTLCKALMMPFFPRGTTRFFTNFVKETIRIRQERGIIRPDMIHLLMETRKEDVMKKDRDRLEISDEDIAAQAFIFYIGGFHTVAAPLTFMGHALATHPDIQKKLQAEIDETIEECKGELTYEALVKMKYLDMVISETLRIWPSLPVLNRLCTKPYTMPPSTSKGKPVQIPAGQHIILPVIALHHDPQYFPNPECFDPERFSDENKDKINPYAYMPFGFGPRNCIGSRLGLLEIKTFFFYFLLNFDFAQIEKTENPLMLNRRSFIMKSETDVWVAIKPRDK